jgi:dTMP kinase
MANFICLEGGDGSGKSTLLARVEQHLKERGFKFLTTREPGGTPVAEEIRNLLLKPGKMAPMAELMLYEAARAEHVEQVIGPALKENTHVLCDRFIHSTLAYQGYARGLGVELVTRLNEAATGGLHPHAVIWLKIEPELAKKRTASRGAENRLDAEKSAFHQKVYDAFLKMTAAEPKTFIVLNAEANPDEIFHELITHSRWIELFGAIS